MTGVGLVTGAGLVLATGGVVFLVVTGLALADALALADVLLAAGATVFLVPFTAARLPACSNLAPIEAWNWPPAWRPTVDTLRAPEAGAPFEPAAPAMTVG